MQVAYPDPRTMSFSSLESELTTLRKKVCETENKLEESERKGETKDIQIDALLKVNHLAGAMLNNVTATMPPLRKSWLKKNIQDMASNIKNLICEITSSSKDQTATIFAKLYHAAIGICNFIYDHFAEIAIIATLALGAATMLMQVVFLGAYVLGYTAPAAAGSAVGLEFLHSLVLV